MADGCTNCAELEAEIMRLESENEELKRIIEELKDKLKAIREFCLKILERTKPVLSRRSGVPRGQWSYVSGLDKVADPVEKMTH